MPSSAEDNMIKQVYPKSLPGIMYYPRCHKILRAWLKLARGVIMRNDYRARSVLKRVREDLSWVNLRGVYEFDGDDT
jgi:hypothetical protein